MSDTRPGNVVRWAADGLIEPTAAGVCEVRNVMSKTNDRWIEVWNCAWLHEAQFFKSLLEARGIKVSLPDEYTLGVDPTLGPALGGVRLLVRSRDVSQARDLIRSASKGDSDIDTKLG